MKTVRFWVLPNDAFNTLSGLNELLRDFQRERRELRVDVRVRTSAQIWSDLMVLAKRPGEVEPPDLVQMPGTWTSSLAELEQIVDLDSLDARIAPESFHPLVQAHCRLEGQRRVYSVPWFVELRTLAYRPAAFRRAGVESALVGTWEGFREACRALAAAKVTPLGNGHPRYAFSLEELAPRVWARGGDFFSRDGKRCIFQREEGHRGAADFLELWAEGWMPLPGADGLAPGSLDEDACAMQFSGRLATEGEGIETAAFPGDEPTVASAQHVAIAAASSQPREALELARYLAEPKSQASYAASIRALPALSSACEEAVAGARSREVLSRSLAGARPLPSNPFSATLERIFSRMADSLARHVGRGSYKPEVLRQELVHAAAEMDYVFMLS
jgi:ABC-type glycerol-3-phosphate transport system substrate-binding protein